MAQYSSNLIGMPAGGYGTQATRMSALDRMVGTPGMFYAGGNPAFDESSGQMLGDRIRYQPWNGRRPPTLGTKRPAPIGTPVPSRTLGGGMQPPRGMVGGMRPLPQLPRAGAGTPVPKVNTPEGAQQYINRIREIDEARRSKYGTGARPTVYTREDEERDRLAQALRLQGYTSNDQGSWEKTGPRIRRTGRMVNGRMVFEERPMTPAEEAAEAAKAARRGQSIGYRGF